MGQSKIGFIITRRLTIFYLASAALLLSPSLLIAGSEKIPAEIIAQTANDEATPVLVGLNVPWQRESTLSDDAILLQRQAINLVQDQLLSELAGTRYKIVRRYEVIPGLALEIGPDALAVLAKSTSVTNVLPDKPASPTARSPVNRSVTTEVRDIGAVPAELFKEVARTGTVLVLVGLKAPWSPEGSLNANLVSAQREAIAAAQNYLLTELADTKYRITRRYDKIPGIALEVGLDALKVLARSVAVTNVLQDRPASAAK
jgi:hypothetical protein